MTTYTVQTIYDPTGKHNENTYRHRTSEAALRHADLLRKQGWKIKIIADVTV
jgi:hypothetical protein